jgi:hypothetical protein
VKAAIAAIGDDAWAPIHYPNAIFDQTTQAWISTAEVAEIPFTAFAAQKKANQIPGRLVVRRIPDLNPHPGQATLFDTWRFHAFFTTSTLDTITADKTHRGHAIIEQVHSDLKARALTHLPSSSFSANIACPCRQRSRSTSPAPRGALASVFHAEASARRSAFRMAQRGHAHRRDGGARLEASGIGRSTKPRLVFDVRGPGATGAGHRGGALSRAQDFIEPSSFSGARRHKGSPG